MDGYVYIRRFSREFPRCVFFSARDSVWLLAGYKRGGMRLVSGLFKVAAVAGANARAVEIFTG